MPLKCMERCKKSVFWEIGDLTKVPQYGASLTAVNVTIPSYSPQTYLFNPIYLFAGLKTLPSSYGCSHTQKGTYSVYLLMGQIHPPDPDFERIHYQISCTNFLVMVEKSSVGQASGFRFF